MHVTGDDDLSSQKAMVVDARIMPYMISTPKRDVIPYLNERLNCIVFENKAVVPNRVLCEKGAAAADITNQIIPQTFSLVILLRPEPVHFCITQGHKHFMILRWIMLGEVFKGDHR